MAERQQALVIGEDDLLEAELRARDVDLVRDAPAAAVLVTLAPPVELLEVDELEPATLRRLLSSWVEEPFFAAQPWLRRAMRRGSGSWVAVTSSLGTRPFPGGAIGAAAVALHVLVRVAAMEGVRANAVAPGWREDWMPKGLDGALALTDTPGGALATAADVAGVVAWLLSEDAAHVNGEVLRVDGAYTISPGSRADPRSK